MGRRASDAEAASPRASQLEKELTSLRARLGEAERAREGAESAARDARAKASAADSDARAHAAAKTATAETARRDAERRAAEAVQRKIPLGRDVVTDAIGDSVRDAIVSRRLLVSQSSTRTTSLRRCGTTSSELCDLDILLAIRSSSVFERSERSEEHTSELQSP